jgi:hypothetical protein
MKYLMVAVEFANGVPCPHAGHYLKKFDHDHDRGRGFGVFTPHRRKAKRFDTQEELFEFWKRQSKRYPIRSDGEPNRPLTALTVTIEKVDE